MAPTAGPDAALPKCRQFAAKLYFTSDTPIESYLKDLSKIFMTKKLSKAIERTVEFAGEVVGAPVVGVRRLLKGQLLGSPEKKSKLDKVFAEQYR